MEFWVLILTVWAFFRWVLTRIRRRKEDERFANVIEALNKFEARFRDVTRLEKRVQELEQKLASSGTAAAPPAPPPVEHLPVVVPPPIEIPKLIVPRRRFPPLSRLHRLRRRCIRLCRRRRFRWCRPQNRLCRRRLP